MSIPKTVGDGEKLIVRVTNSKDPIFGVIKGEKTIVVKKPKAVVKKPEAAAKKAE